METTQDIARIACQTARNQFEPVMTIHANTILYAANRTDAEGRLEVSFLPHKVTSAEYLR